LSSGLVETVIRRLDKADASALLELRGLALATSPGAFASSPDTDRISTVDAAVSILSDTASQAVFGAFDSNLIGMVGIRRESHKKLAHRAYLWGMFVDPRARSRGIGRRLVEEAVDFARQLDGVGWVDLSVSEDAPEAVEMYRNLGFVEWGVQSDALRVDGRSLSERYCALRLDDSA
jgi:ribosomal protein S18 acetylase RimI-like enzyme